MHGVGVGGNKKLLRVEYNSFLKIQNGQFVTKTQNTIEIIQVKAEIFFV
jgi:hypothetical protein